ncbi:MULTISPECIES: glycosyl transferase family protein [unclassified Sphingomonas]|uniref:glycosyl transferase family protein n=1 Tax=unclassified Sphingomonas TaxID=196159 RepID=UPI0009EC39C0|nr:MULTISPECIES: glycosyl transferase family protein [unclassified Sphingomonas]
MATAIPWIDAIVRETMLAAAIGLLIGGIDDLAVDLAYLIRALRRRWRRSRALTLADFPVESCSARIAVLVPAWDESAVIGAMLRATIARIDHPDWRLYVGAYPNDRATIDAIAAVANGDGRIRLVLTERPGPTTKADCLNALWRAATADGVGERHPFTAMVLHDAEDVVHPGELRVYDRMLRFADTVQLPVLPLPDPASLWVSGHYIDEFSEAHGRQMPVRAALRAGLPLAGVGCAISAAMLERIAGVRGGLPFDETSLTEDYELGLTVRALGGRGLFVRVLETPGGPPVAVRAFFPATLDAAVRQKARWMTGITLAGWDRTGWQRGAGVQEHWMRMRDRRTILAIPVLALAYLALLVWGLAGTAHAIAGTTLPVPDSAMRWLLAVNFALLAWRVLIRAILVARNYGRGQALRSVPRLLVGNGIALLAARRAIMRYLRSLRGGTLVWDKTAHHFPTAAELNLP